MSRADRARRARHRNAKKGAPRDHKGAMAFIAGLPIEACPYGGHEAKAWVRGWKDAKRRKEKEERNGT